MKVLYGKVLQELSRADFQKRICGFNSIHIDIGTGSGRFVVENAKKDDAVFFVGIDPVAENMKACSYRMRKWSKHSGVDNALFVVASIETPPEALLGIADSISVILPWGSLRDGIVCASPEILRNIRSLGKPATTFMALIAYDDEREKDEMQRRSLPKLSVGHFDQLAGIFSDNKIEITAIEEIGNRELKLLESDWARRLGHGIKRTVYRLSGRMIC